MRDPVTVIVFGSTGDLMRRKLVPAFFELWNQGVLNEDCLIVGVGRRSFNDVTFRAFLSECLEAEQRTIFEHLNIRYFTGDITTIEGMSGMRQFLELHEKKECMGRLFYLATSYIFFPTIVSALAREGLHELRCGWTRLAFEKPFGQSLSSAGTLESGIHKTFPEDVIYRIDHYLAKEGARLLLAAKESCPALRKVLSRAYVSEIQIIAEETVGVGERIAYYNESGAIKDMVQSHLLQLVALVLGEPATWSTEAIHRAKLRVLESLKLGKVGEQYIGQYQSYNTEVAAHAISASTIETYARIVMQSALPAWSGVPLIIRTGKKLPEKKTEIRILFRTGAGHSAVLSVILHPAPALQFMFKGTIPLALQAAADEVTVFTRTWNPHVESDDGYSFLLERVIAGDQRWFVKKNEVEASWLLIDELERMRSSVPLDIYPDGNYPRAIQGKV